MYVFIGERMGDLHFQMCFHVQSHGFLAPHFCSVPAKMKLLGTVSIIFFYKLRPYTTFIPCETYEITPGFTFQMQSKM